MLQVSPAVKENEKAKINMCGGIFQHSMTSPISKYFAIITRTWTNMKNALEEWLAIRIQHMPENTVLNALGINMCVKN